MIIKLANRLQQKLLMYFWVLFFRSIEIYKIKIFSQWDQTKRNLNEYPNAPVYSEIEGVHYILHCMRFVMLI
jgi:hypothetical protein